MLNDSNEFWLINNDQYSIMMIYLVWPGVFT